MTDTFDAVLAKMRDRQDLVDYEIADYADRLAAAHATEVNHQSQCAQEWFDRFQQAEARAEAAERDARELREAVQRAESLLSKFIATTEQARGAGA